MKIIEYEDKYLEDVKNLLVELEEYIVSIDKDNLDQVHPEYRDKMAVLDLEKVNSNNGKCFIAVENDKAIGLIMGCIFPYDKYDYLDYKCRGCEYVLVDVFAYNENAIKFYDKNNYHSRMYSQIKKL